MRVLKSETMTLDGRIYYDGKPLTGVLYEQAPDYIHMLPERLVIDGVIGPVDDRVPADVRRIGAFAN
jgi:hypothetical protein